MLDRSVPCSMSQNASNKLKSTRGVASGWRTHYLYVALFLLTISVRNIDFIEDSFVFTNTSMFGRLDLTTYAETVFLPNSQQVVTPTHTPRSAQLNVIPFLNNFTHILEER